MNKTIAILGIHTGIGKTVASAVMAEALDADYWKPVQAGLEERDSTFVSSMITAGAARVHPEAVLLKLPMSPHAAAAAEDIEIDVETIIVPAPGRLVLLETAGGVLSPMSATTTMADFVAHIGCPAILVSANYLGSINHTLMSIEVIRQRNIPLLGMVMSGDPHISSEEFIESYSGVPIIARIPRIAEMTPAAIATQAAAIREALTEKINAWQR